MKSLYKKIAILSFVVAILAVGGQIVMAKIQNPTPFSMRWLAPFHGSFAPAVTSQTFTAGTVLMAEFQNPVPGTVDQLCFVTGGTSAGEVTVGIYGPVTAETSTGAALLVESASTAASTINVPHCIALTATYMPAGLYYAALEGSDATGTYMRHSNQTQIVGYGATYARGGGYGALTNPAPVTTNTGSAIPGLKIRVTAN